MHDRAVKSTISIKNQTIWVYLTLFIGISLLILSSLLSWVRVTAADGLGIDRVITIAGKTYSPLLTALFIALICGWAIRIMLHQSLNKRIDGVIFFSIILMQFILGIIPLTVVFSHQNTRRNHLRDLPQISHKYVLSSIDLQLGGIILGCIGGVCVLSATGFLLGKILYDGFSSRNKTLNYTPQSDISIRDSTGICVTDSTHSEASYAGEKKKKFISTYLWDELDQGKDPTVDNT